LTSHNYPHPINLKTANGPSTADFRKIFEVSPLFTKWCTIVPCEVLLLHVVCLSVCPSVTLVDH